MSGTTRSCANCGRGPVVSIYQQRHVPVQDVLLIRDRDTARTFPTGHIELGFCHDCGYAENVAFEPVRVRYSGECEETQSCSGIFGAFQEDVVRRLVANCRLDGGHVVEIGCGKGEFLARLCARAGSRGTGFDPAFVPGRVELPAGVQVYPVNFEGDERFDAVDLLCCVMTLEHIATPRRFLGNVRQAIERSGVPVYFQVPNAQRIYRQAAFWDIYYEHCNYFTAPALEILFATSGFTVESIESAYDDQYLCILARTSDAATTVPSDARITAVRNDAEWFAANVDRVMNDWQRLIAQAGEGGVVLWGGGSKAVALLTALTPGHAVRCVVDINAIKQGTYLPVCGYEVVAPARLGDVNPALVIVMNPVYREEVESDLAGLGLSPRVIALP